MNLIIAYFSAGGVSTIKYQNTVDECLKVAESHGISYDYKNKLKEAEKNYKRTMQKEQKTRLRRSKLADLIYVLQTHFNNHYFTLTPRFSHQCAPPVFMLLT